ncbi:uncharacterized protein LOC120518640 isoform X2 [Polypterus senegalus]|uniref:uncharacterized protein LOC120518640 isoform X2 n=1 Tax=Polypterus senegalus TaxID=55291 RepID=UPI0019663A12|nr:uncharacterized protein LOC120518640 isoform X2 [Polypterus senegalus]
MERKINSEGFDNTRFDHKCKKKKNVLPTSEMNKMPADSSTFSYCSVAHYVVLSLQFHKSISSFFFFNEALPQSFLLFISFCAPGSVTMQCLCVLLLVTICHVRTSATQGSLEKPHLSLDVKSLLTGGRLTAHCPTNVTPGGVTCSLYVGNTSVTSETTTGDTCDFEVSRSQLDGDPVTFKTVQLSCDYQPNGGTGDQRSPRSDPKELLLLAPLQKATLQVTPTSITLEEKIQISCEVNKNHTGVKCQLYDNETKLEDGQCRWTMTGRQLMNGTGPGMVLLTCDYTLDVWQKQPDIKDQFDTRSNRVTVTVTDPGPSQTTQTDFTSAGTSTGNEPQDQESNKTSSLPLYLGTGFAVLAFFILVGTMLICNRRKQKSKRPTGEIQTVYVTATISGAGSDVVKLNQLEGEDPEGAYATIDSLEIVEPTK